MPPALLVVTRRRLAMPLARRAATRLPLARPAVTHLPRGLQAVMPLPPGPLVVTPLARRAHRAQRLALVPMLGPQALAQTPPAPALLQAAYAELAGPDAG